MSAESATRVVWKVFFVWQSEKEERWLEEMAREGWHLVRGGIRFTFRQGPPAEVRYRLDYRRGSDATLEELQSLCRDAGWEYVERFLDWHYYRTASASAPELYTDTESLIERDRRILGLLLGVLMMMIVVLAGGNRVPSGRMAPVMEYIRFLQFAITMLLAYAIIRMLGHLRALRTRPPA